MQIVVQICAITAWIYVNMVNAFVNYNNLLLLFCCNQYVSSLIFLTFMTFVGIFVNRKSFWKLKVELVSGKNVC